MKILLLGGTGMLGGDCKEVLSETHEVIAPSKSELDIVSWDGVIENLQSISPDVVLNCAAFTDVDACEKQAFKVRKVNVEGPRNLAQGCARFHCKLVHISSDYIFSGKKGVPQPYFEDDPGEPLSAYGKSKLESEVAVKENAPDYIIVRSGWLFGKHGENFITSILRNVLLQKSRRKTLRVVSDQFGSPTWTYRLALQIKELLETDSKGTYHATAEGYCSRLEFAQHVFKKLKLKVVLEPCQMSDFPRPAKRPANCLLENRLLKKLGINIMPHWKEDVDAFLSQYGQDLIKKIRAKKR